MDETPAQWGVFIATFVVAGLGWLSAYWFAKTRKQFRRFRIEANRRAIARQALSFIVSGIVFEAVCLGSTYVTPAPHDPVIKFLWWVGMGLYVATVTVVYIVSYRSFKTQTASPQPQTTR